MSCGPAEAVDEEEEDGKPASLPMGFFDDPEVSPHISISSPLF